MSIVNCLSPFKIVYGIEPLSPLDLIPRPLDGKPSVEASKRVEEIKHIHEQVKLGIEKSNAVMPLIKLKPTNTRRE